MTCRSQNRRGRALAAALPALILALAANACRSSSAHGAAGEPFTPRDGAAGVAVIDGHGFQKISGYATFEDTTQGLRISVDVQNATPGEHALFVCEGADCDVPGEPLNPKHLAHGKRGVGDHHAGDLGNLLVDANGLGHFELICDDLTARDGSSCVIGRTIVVTERADDFKTQPTGASGRYIACGMILKRE